MSTRAALWTAQEAAQATGGKPVGEWSAYGVSIDTRSLERGDLFIALKGERDGHAFVADALQKGAAAALVSEAPSNVAPDAPLLIVGDTQAALEALGRAARMRAAAKIVAVTGSAGKTTTKEMLRLMLGAAGSVAASAASYNNHWGVPLSLARMARDRRLWRVRDRHEPRGRDPRTCQTGAAACGADHHHCARPSRIFRQR